jgi:hypothetical protein
MTLGPAGWAAHPDKSTAANNADMNHLVFMSFSPKGQPHRMHGFGLNIWSVPHAVLSA